MSFCSFNFSPHTAPSALLGRIHWTWAVDDISELTIEKYRRYPDALNFNTAGDLPLGVANAATNFIEISWLSSYRPRSVRSTLVTVFDLFLYQL